MGFSTKRSDPELQEGRTVVTPPMIARIEGYFPPETNVITNTITLNKMNATVQKDERTSLENFTKISDDKIPHTANNPLLLR